MTPQEIFDRVVEHLYKQGNRSTDTRLCRYHNEDGTKCAIGVLIPEDIYFEEIDQNNRSIKYLLAQYKDKFPEWMHENVALLSELQSVHDKQHNWSSVENMVKALYSVAQYHNLNSDIIGKNEFYPVVDKEEE